MEKKMLTYKDIDASILKGLPNPTGEAYEIKIKIPEFTFLGVKEQPDFADVFITFYPKKRIIELKSLKQYVYHAQHYRVARAPHQCILRSFDGSVRAGACAC